MNNRFNTDEELIKELKLLMIKSLNVVLRTFPSIDNIMFVSDGGSWRNNIEIPEFLQKEGVEYKGNRVQDPNTDWKVIFDGYHDFIDTMKNCGINVYREQNIEGDDWCWYLSQKLNSEGTNCIIWTRDHDLMQLVKTNSDGCFTAWYEKDIERLEQIYEKLKTTELLLFDDLMNDTPSEQTESAIYKEFSNKALFHDKLIEIWTKINIDTNSRVDDYSSYKLSIAPITIFRFMPSLIIKYIITRLH